MLKEQRLTPIKFIEQRRNGALWLFKCKCGKEKIIRYINFKNNATRSCGCLSKERDWQIKHGLSRTRFGHIFKGMKQRCEDKNCKAYKSYGAKGIKLCWKNTEDFKRDMYKSYLDHVKKFGEKQTTIDRINPKGNYCKENCRWATYKEQASNRTRGIKKYLFGEDYLTIDQISKICKIENSLTRMRIYTGWKKEDFIAGCFISKRNKKNSPLKKLFLRFGKVISPKEREIISLRVGINCVAKTLQEVGDIFGITRERVRQIEEKATLKMYNELPERKYFKSIEEIKLEELKKYAKMLRERGI